MWWAPNLVELPPLWSSSKCNIIITNISIGSKKWRVKNSFNIESLIKYLPQSQRTKVFPNKGMTVKRLVITVAAQQDIFPIGRTYPIKATIIATNSKSTPKTQIVESEYLLWKKAFNMWRYITRKKHLAPFICRCCVVNSQLPFLIIS